MHEQNEKEHAKTYPFLWFDDQAEEAVQFYTSIFDDSKIGRIFRGT
jgi:predicted 3-demethylubiquinone-9 3-methyltransferase (glyoxalase superfamily)